MFLALFAPSLALFALEVEGGLLIWLGWISLAITAWVFVHDGQTRKAGALFFISMIAFAVLVGVVLPSHQSRAPEVSEPMAQGPETKSESPPGQGEMTADPSQPAATPTLAPPKILVDSAGVGGPDEGGPERHAAFVTNQGDTSVMVAAGLLDTDERQQQVYVQTREDIGPGERVLLDFYAWYEGACYQPVVVVALTHNGREYLKSWMETGGNARPLPGLTASGDVKVQNAGEPFCVAS
jgi:hypothetical protein